MKETCEDCPNIAKCKEICEKIEDQLGETPDWSIERPESLLNEKQRYIEKDSGNPSGIDRFRKINPARVYSDAIDTEIEWEETPPQPEAAEIENPERKKLMESIEIATRRKGLKFSRRFRSFLMCEKIVRIAERSGTTKQNIQKQFQLTVDKAYQVISKSKRIAKATITPSKFKKKISLPNL
jgi:hypothetical protein